MVASLKNLESPLGKSDVKLSPLGLGTVKFGRNEKVKYPGHFEIPDEDFLRDFLDLAKSLGITTLDTAPAYGASEERLGRLLKRDRDEWTIIAKAGEYFKDGESFYDFSSQSIERSLHSSLKKLDTSYVDVFLLHSDGRDKDILADKDLLDKLYQFKAQGLIKACGISSKTVEGGLKGIDLLDCVMATYNPFYKEEEPVLKEAERKKKGIILKKALASGHLDKINAPDPVQASLSCAYGQPSVSSVIIGTIHPEHLRSNVRAALKAIHARHPKAASL